jgi:hypothetical protein
MSRLDVMDALNEAFAALYRSYGAYLADASLNLDVDRPELVQSIWERDRELVRDFGDAVYRRFGHVETGGFETYPANLQFANISSLLPTWRKEQAKLITKLETSAEKIRAAGDAEALSLIESALKVERHAADELSRPKPLPQPV